jgi:hypothetical protein
MLEVVSNADCVSARLAEVVRMFDPLVVGLRREGCCSTSASTGS